MLKIYRILGRYTLALHFQCTIIWGNFIDQNGMPFVFRLNIHGTVNAACVGGWAAGGFAGIEKEGRAEQTHSQYPHTAARHARRTHARRRWQSKRQWLPSSSATQTEHIDIYTRTLHTRDHIAVLYVYCTCDRELSCTFTVVAAAFIRINNKKTTSLLENVFGFDRVAVISCIYIVLRVG